MNRLQRNKIIDRLFSLIGIVCTLIGLVVLGALLIKIFNDGFGRLTGEFFRALPSRFPEKAGILTAWTGTLWILSLTALISIPLGVGAAIYLEEYSKKGWASRILEVNIANLAGVPSIVYGILGLGIFVRTIGLGESVLSGALILSLLIMPIIIVATREALKAVPKTIKEASRALGASKWQTIWQTAFQIMFKMKTLRTAHGRVKLQRLATKRAV